jgi:cobalt-zinc-cadmium efflux system membrane fusion protein
MNFIMKPLTVYPFNVRARQFGVLVLFALTSVITACSKSDKPVAEAPPPAKTEHAEDGNIKLSAEDVARAGIKAEVLAPRAIADLVTVTATIRPNQDRMARAVPRIEGRIVQVTAKLGDTVKAGQALATLDSVAVGESQATLLNAQNSQRLAQADFKRAESLAAEEIIPQRDFLRARSELEKATAEVRAADNKLRLLGGTSKAGGGTASTFPLLAPLSGTVIQKKAVVGELGTPTEPMFTIADLSTLWIEANLSEDLLAKVRLGASAVVTVNAYPAETFPGRVTYIASVLDKETRTVPARIEVDNKSGRLKPEMFASATIETGSAKLDVLSVPDAAIVLLQGLPNVFVSEHGGYEARPVELGSKLSGRTTIKSGVASGENVVTAGTYALKARMLKSQIGDAH